MFTTFPPSECVPLEQYLPAIKNFEKKLKAVSDYLKIHTVFCQGSQNDIEKPFQPLKEYEVNEVIILGGDPGFIKSLLKDTAAKLCVALEAYVASDEEFETIRSSLQRCLEICQKGFDENNLQDDFTFDHCIKYNLYLQGAWTAVPIQCLSISGEVWQILTQHFNNRKGFFNKLKNVITAALEKHITLPSLTDSVCQWDSTDAAIEVAELFYVLTTVVPRIKPKDDISDSQFRKLFFNFFGLKEKDYANKCNRIMSRKNNKHFLSQLSQHLETLVQKKIDVDIKRNRKKS
jgi:hypothetical protein